MLRILQAFFLALLLLGAPISSTIVPGAGASAAHAGFVKKSIVAYAVAKAIQFGGRIVVRKVVDLARDPRTRREVIEHILDFAIDNPSLQGRADELLQAIGENMPLSEHLAARLEGAPAVADIIEALPETVAEVFAENQVPYSPGIGRRLAELAGEVIDSKTFPTSGPNVRLAGQSKEVMIDGEDFNIPFDQRGFAVFDDHSMFDTRLPALGSGRAADFVAATADLKEAIQRGEVDINQFTNEQIDAIMKGRGTLPGLTWHHHQDCGRMQLIPRALHQAVKHIGGIGVC